MRSSSGTSIAVGIKHWLTKEETSSDQESELKSTPEEISVWERYVFLIIENKHEIAAQANHKFMVVLQVYARSWDANSKCIVAALVTSINLENSCKLEIDLATSVKANECKWLITLTAHFFIL